METKPSGVTVKLAPPLVLYWTSIWLNCVPFPRLASAKLSETCAYPVVFMPNRKQSTELVPFVLPLSSSAVFVVGTSGTSSLSMVPTAGVTRSPPGEKGSVGELIIVSFSRRGYRPPGPGAGTEGLYPLLENETIINSPTDPFSPGGLL